MMNYFFVESFIILQDSLTYNQAFLQDLFLKLQELHDNYCVHVDVKIPDNVQESFNDFFFARHQYSLGGETVIMKTTPL